MLTRTLRVGCMLATDLRRSVMSMLTRRGAMKAAGLGVAGVAIGGLAGPSRAQEQVRSRKRALRLAHLTDLHTQPELKAGEGVASCVAHVQGHKDRPQLILLGGDLVMDSFDSGDARTKEQWDVFERAFKKECRIPVDGCLGNHDIWGINKTKSKTTGNEPGWGKKRAMDILGMSRAYKSFPMANWKFIMLDSVMPQGESYIGKLDDEQWEWLDGELKGTNPNTPILVLSHIPILTATQLVQPAKKESKKREIGDSLMMADATRFVAAFAKYPNVKLCLSGHIHEIDRVEYQGVTYLCNGAVSGNWWKGRHKQCDEGYSLIDLFEDGTFENTYVRYGWKAGS